MVDRGQWATPCTTRSIAACGEGGLVRRAFDAVGTSRDDNPFVAGNGTGKFPGYILTV